MVTTQIITGDIRKILDQKPCIPVQGVKGSAYDWQMIFCHQITAMEMREDPIKAFHQQDFYELLIFVRGSKKIFIEDAIYLPKCGDIFLFPPGIRHKGITVADNTYERYYIYLNKKFLDTLCVEEMLHRCFLAHKTGSNPVLLSEEEREKLMALLARMSSLEEPYQPAAQFFLFTSILDILMTINTYVNLRREQKPLPERRELLPPLFERLLEYINENFSTICTMDSVAAQFNVSYSYLSRLFQRYLHVTPYQYLQSRKLSYAQELLRRGERVTDACFGAGFTDCSHFGRLFRRAFGVTPREYRNG